MKVKIENKEYDFESGITLEEIYEKIEDKTEFPVLAAYIDNEIHALTQKVKKDCTVRFIDFSTREGNKIYQKGLIFLLYYTVHKMYNGKNMIRVCHSIDKGIRIRTDFIIDDNELNKIYENMQDIVKQALPIKKCLVKMNDAINYFKAMKREDKVGTLKYITNHYVNLYKIDDAYEYLFSVMPINTNVFTRFRFKKLNQKEFVLEFPGVKTNGEIPEYISREKIVEAYNTNYKLSTKLGIFTASDINKAIATGRIKDIIMLDEVVSNTNLLYLAKNIYEGKDKIRIVLIAGPSSSGKTTTARKLSTYLKSFGLNPKPLSVDNYFMEREETPKLPNGEYDYESLRAIDVDLFNDHLTKLLNHEKVNMPTYNFKSGKKEYLGKELKLDEDDILIIEGLHCLNEELTKSIPRENKYKIYVSPFTDLNVDELNMVSTSDIRLIRRIVRDNRTRGYTALDTIKSWSKVRSGEEDYIFPLQQEADIVYNSSLIYELGVLKLYVEPLLYGIDTTSEYYEEARRLINFLSMFLVVPTETIPAESILREFIGGSYFE